MDRWYSWLPGPPVNSHKGKSAVEVGQRYTITSRGSGFNTAIGVYVDVDGSLTSAMLNRVSFRAARAQFVFVMW